MKAIRKFGWSVIGEAVLGILKDTETMVLSEEYPDDLENPKLLKVGGFGNDLTKQSFVKAAVENGLDVRSTAVAHFLWECVTTHTEIVEEVVVAKLQQKESHGLVPFTNCFSQCIADLDEEDDMCVKLRDIAAKRCKWLREMIRRLEMPFTWEMPYARETKEEILAFLRGPDETMTMKFKERCWFEPENFVKDCLSHGGPWHASVTVEIFSREK
ncbi:hypothetical protein V7S43_007538 [Phytophthora oleae]|uniref:Uncharacterized protein n=1 Tax=Phytophthora oleae TaxID=2107226 RepID=A0ABD3FQM6_9STRA